MEEWKDGRVEEWKNRCGLLKDRFFRAGENYRVAEGSFFEKPKNDRVRMPISQSSTPLKGNNGRAGLNRFAFLTKICI